jgi:hypothetical protein
VTLPVLVAGEVETRFVLDTGIGLTLVSDRVGKAIGLRTGAPELSQPNPDVMLQHIVYDGLVGDAFLRNFVVTYDVIRGQMIFARPGSGARPRTRARASPSRRRR